MAVSSDTIFALSSGSLPAGVAVLRISGAQASAALQRLTGESYIQPRHASLKTIRNRNGEVIDQALVINFPAPRSFTGEDCVEIHVHGGRAVVSAVSEELGSISGMRPAEAGEFTQRAFENGKMDLLEVEGLADLLKSETEMQRRLAVEQTSGKLSELYDSWAHQLTRCRALIEAELDFADEDDVPDSVAEQVWETVSRLKAAIGAHLVAGGGSEIIRDGFKVALVGAPNVGKSSLLNALAERDVAIVTDIAGTTRDVLSVDLNIDGYFVTLYDTAGIRSTDDIVEQEGVRRAKLTAANADLILHLSSIDSDPQQINGEGRLLTVTTKSDIGGGDFQTDLYVSSKTREGLDALKRSIKTAIEERTGGALSLMPVRLRHKKRLEETLNYVSDALGSGDMDLAIRSEYLRLAATSLGRITGRVDVEDLLGVIFSEFCIGK